MIRKHKIGIKIITAVLGTLLLLIPFAGCAAEAPGKTLIFADTGFDSIHVSNSIAAFILEHGYGYQSDSNPCSTTAMMAGLETGDIDVNMELYVTSAVEAYEKTMATGKVLDLGTNYPDGWEGWLVPTYMIEDGDLPEGVSVFDLPDYWELFKDPEDPTKGRFISCIPGWFCVKTNEEKFEAYGLLEYYNLFLPGSDPALSASMVAACEKHEPWFGYYWEPTWILGKLDMTKIEEPPYDEEVWKTTRGCAYPVSPVIILVSASLEDRAPEAVEFLRNFETTAAMMNEMLAYMQENEVDAPEGAIWFLKNYESLWTQWVPADVAEKVKAALVA